MNITVKQLAVAGLSIVAVVLVFMLVFHKNNGVIAQLPEYFNEKVTGYYEKWQEDIFAEVIGADRPTITLLETGSDRQLAAGQTYDLSKLFLAKDEAGNEISVKVVDVSTVAGEQILYVRDENGAKQFLQDATAFIFPAAGCYNITVTAIDKNWKRTVQTVEVAVQGVNK